MLQAGGDADQKMLFDDIHRLLRNPNIQIFSHSRVENLLSAGKDISQRLLEISGFYCFPKKSSLEKLKLQPYPVKELNCILSLSQLLQVDEMQCSDMWLQYHKQTQIKSTGKMDIFKCINLREFYFRQRKFIWLSVIAILEISTDQGHLYYTPVRMCLSALLQGGILTNCLRQLSHLYEWQYPMHPTSTLLDQSDHKSNWAKSWALQQSLEVALALDATYMLAQHYPLNFIQFTELLTLGRNYDFSVPRCMLTCGSIPTCIHGAAADNYRFRWIAIFATTFKFSAFIPYPNMLIDVQSPGAEVGETLVHPLLSGFTDALADTVHSLIMSDFINPMQRNLTHDKNQKDMDNSAVTSSLRMFWCILLCACSSDDNKRQQEQHMICQWIKRTWLEKLMGAVRLEFAMQSLSDLLERTVPVVTVYGTQAAADNYSPLLDSQSNKVTFLNMCASLQDMLNCTLKFGILSMNPPHLFILSSLTSHLYRNQPALCSRLWQHLKKSIEQPTNYIAHPLCSLIITCLHNITYESVYLCKILGSLVVDAHSAELVLSLLVNTPVHVMSIVDKSKLSIATTDGDQVLWIAASECVESLDSENLRGCRVRLASAVDDSTYGEAILTIPVLASEGKVVDVDLVEYPSLSLGDNLKSHVLVRWSFQSTWLAILMDATTSHVRCSNTNVITSCWTLLASVLAHSGYRAQSAFTSHWSDLTLHSALRMLGHDELFSTFIQNGISLTDLSSCDQKLSSRQHSLGLSTISVEKLGTQLRRLPKDFRKSFWTVVANKICTGMLSILSVGSSDTRKSTADTIEMEPRLKFLSSSICLLANIASQSPSLRNLISLTLFEHFPVSGALSFPTQVAAALGLNLGSVRSQSRAFNSNYGFTVINHTIELFLTLIPSFLVHSPQAQLKKLIFHNLSEGDFEGAAKVNSAPKPLRLLSGDGVNQYAANPVSSNRLNSSEISQDQFLLAMKRIGLQNISDDTIKSLFRRVDGKGNGFIQMGQLLTTILSSEIHINPALHSNERALVNYLQQYLSHDLTAEPTLILLETFLTNVLIPCLFASGSADDRQLAAHAPCHGSLRCVTIRALLSFFTLAETSPACLSIARKVLDDVCVIRAIVTSACQLPRHCVRQQYERTDISQTVRFSTLPRSTDTSLTSNSDKAFESVFPLDFTQGIRYLSDGELDSLMTMGVDALSLTNLILEIGLDSNLEQSYFQKLLVEVLYENNFIQPELKLMKGSVSDCTMSHLTLLASWLFYPRSTPNTALVSPTETSVAILTKITQYLPTIIISSKSTEMKPKSLFDLIGWVNVPSLIGILSEILRDKSERDSKHRWLLKLSVMELLLALAIHNPICLAVMLGTKPSSKGGHSYSALSVPSIGVGGDGLVVALENSLDGYGSSHSIYQECPLFLHKYLELVSLLWSTTHSSGLTYAGIKIAQNKNFWTAALEPLMDNLESAVDVSHQSGDSNMSVISDRTVAHCHRVLAHASALSITTKVMIGAIAALDVEIGKFAGGAVDAFFQRANQAHRFGSWVTHYMCVEYDDELYLHTAKLAEDVGIDLLQLQSRLHLSGGTYNNLGNHSLNVRSHLFGEDYRYCRKHVVLIMENNENGNNDPLQKLLQNLSRVNLMLSLMDSQSVLLRNWRIFMEVFVSAPSLQTAGQGRVNRTHSKGSDADSISDCSDTPQSPSTPIESRFVGDKRSYCLVKEVAKSLSNISLSSLVCVVVATEKSSLLVTMLHHQLRAVSLLASDPKFAKIEVRDIGSARLSVPKMLELLHTIESAFRSLIGAGTPIKSFMPNTVAGLSEDHTINKNTIFPTLKIILTADLMTSFVLLLDSLDVEGKRSGNGLDLSSEKAFPLLCQRIFDHAVSALTDEALSHRLVDAENDLGYGKYSGRLSPQQALINMCVQAINLVIPTDFYDTKKLPNYSWPAELKKRRLSLIALHIFKEISASQDSITKVQLEHDYTAWTDVTALYPAGSVHAKIPPTPNKSTVPVTSLCGDTILIGLVDLFAKCMQAEELRRELLMAGVIRELTSSPVLRNYQLLLSKQPAAKVAVFMNYSASSGEISSMSQLWRRILVLILLAAKSLEAQQYTELGNTVFREICEVIEVYGTLLLAPLYSGRARMSLQQLHLCKDTLSFIAGIDSHARAWRAVLPGLWTEILLRTRMITARIATFLGVDVSHQRELHGSLIAISRAEQKDECSLRVRRRFRKLLLSKGLGAKIVSLQRERSLSPAIYSTEGVKTSPTRSPSPTSSSSGGTADLRNVVSAVSEAQGRAHAPSSASESASYKPGVIMQLLTDAQAIMVDILVDSLSILWHARPSSDDYHVSELSSPLPVSTHIYFRLRPWCGLVEGVVTGANGFGVATAYSSVASQPCPRGYAVELSDGSRVDFVPQGDVAYTTIPLFPFASVDSLQTGLLPSEQGTQVSSVLTTAHVLTILEFCTSYSKEHSRHEGAPGSTATNDSTSALSQTTLQLVASWASVSYVANLEHLSRGFPDTNQLKEQLMAIKKLLSHKPVDISASHSSAAFIDKQDWLELADLVLNRIEVVAEYLGLQLTKKQAETTRSSDESSRFRGPGLRAGPQYQNTRATGVLSHGINDHLQDEKF